MKGHLIPPDELKTLLDDDLDAFLVFRMFTILNGLRGRLELEPVSTDDFLKALTAEIPSDEPDKEKEEKRLQHQEGERLFEKEKDEHIPWSHNKSWDEKFERSKKRDLVEVFLNKIKLELPSAKTSARGSFLKLFSREPLSSRNLFLIVILGKDAVRCCVRDIIQSNEPNGMTHQVKGWFFPRSESRFRLIEQNLDQCVEIAKQSYSATEQSKREEVTSPV